MTLIWQQSLDLRGGSLSPRGRTNGGAARARVREAPGEVEHVSLLLVRLVEGVVEVLLQNDVAGRARELAAAGGLDLDVVGEGRVQDRVADVRRHGYEARALPG